MKTIGLLGGTSWPSTPLYYRHLNEKIAAALGGHHSAKIILYSIDYHPIKSLYPDGWNEISTFLRAELKRLDDMGPDCVLICNNTLHKGYDILVEQQKISLQGLVIPLWWKQRNTLWRKAIKKCCCWALNLQWKTAFLPISCGFSGWM